MRSGGGPNPSNCLALENVVHGMPIQTSLTRCCRKKLKMPLQILLCRTLREGNKQISTGKIGTPSLFNACEILAEPAKSSKQKRLGRPCIVKMSSQLKSLSLSVRPSCHETLALSSFPTTGKTGCPVWTFSPATAGHTQSWRTSSLTCLFSSGPGI